MDYPEQKTGFMPIEVAEHQTLALSQLLTLITQVDTCDSEITQVSELLASTRT